MPNINDQVKEEWKQETTSVERVESVIKTTRTRSSAREIAERSPVSEPMARKYLTNLVEKGIAESVQDGRTTLYKRDEGHFIERRIHEVRESHSHDELIDGIKQMKQQLQAYREQYGVES